MRSIVAAAVLLVALPVIADDFRVTSGADSGIGSLRWAIESANATPGGDTIAIPGPMTIRLAAPLPPITESVAIHGNAFLRTSTVIDGTAAGNCDGLTINADEVTLDGFTIIGFTGDGLVLNAGDAHVSHMLISSNRNGVRIAGRNNRTYGNLVTNNSAAGIWVTGSGSDNQISIPEPPPIPVGPVPTFDPDFSDFVAGNHDGIVLDGDKTFLWGATVRPFTNTYLQLQAGPNMGSGIVVNGVGNNIRAAEVSRNLGSGIVLNAPAEVSQSVGSCNGGPLITGRTEAPPRLSAAVRDVSAYTVEGTISGLPDSEYRVELFSAGASCLSEPAVYEGSVVVSTDASGNAGFQRSFAAWNGSVIATATRTGGGTSSPTSPLAPVVRSDTRTDLVVTFSGPTSVIRGTSVSFATHVTNLGPSAAGNFYIGQTLSSGGKTFDFDFVFCPVIGPGETVVIGKLYPINTMQPKFDFTTSVSFGSYPVTDPDLSNNTATATVAVQSRTRAVRH